MKNTLWGSLLVVSVAIFVSGCVVGDDVVEPRPTKKIEETQPAEVSEPQFPFAEILDNEGGPSVVTGQVEYTNPFFTAGVAEPIIILEDQAGFVDRDRSYLFPPESQVLGQITSDFYQSPFSYSLSLPTQPKGGLRDVDNDGEEDPGIMVFAVAYWTNIWGDPYLEKRDQSGGGWSSAYASTRIDDDRDNYLEVYGGQYLIFAPKENQGFPSGFGEDGKLFTEDDPIVTVPQGWTLVDMDHETFKFSRPSEITVDLYEPESIALDDFSGLSYTEAFEAMLEKMRMEYAFTDLKNIDWNALEAEFLPRFEEAEANGNAEAYNIALRDFLWSIPDGHISMDFSVLNQYFQTETAGGLGLAFTELDDGRIMVNYLTEGGPAEQAGIQFGAEVLAINGEPIDEVLDSTVPWSSPFSTEQNLRLQQLRYATRFSLPQQVSITYQNPGAPQVTATMDAAPEYDSFNFSSFYSGFTGTELPVEFEILDEGYGYAKLVDFLDNELLTIQLWERMMQDLNENQVPGLILDLRTNGGGSGYLADQMAAYFFDEEVVAGNTAFYDDSIDDFYSDPGDEQLLYPPREELRYRGPVVVLVGPACASACEFFAYDMTIDERARIVGQYGTSGLGGSVEDFVMPEDITVRFTIGRAVDPEGEIHIEGFGVVPSVQVEVNEDTLNATYLEGRDVVLEAAIETLSKPQSAGIVPTGPPRIASAEEAEQALGAETPTLEDIAREDYPEEMLLEPTTLVYTIPLAQSRDVLWVTGWCADPDRFDQNWDNIGLEMSLNGENVRLSEFQVIDFPSNELQCRFYYSLLTDWPAGEHRLVTDMIFTAEINDGSMVYSPGTRTFEYRVFVDS